MDSLLNGPKVLLWCWSIACWTHSIQFCGFLPHGSHVQLADIQKEEVRKRRKRKKINRTEERKKKKLTYGNFYKEQKITKIDHYACTRVILWWAFLFFLDKLSSHFVNVTPSNNKNHTPLSAGQVTPSEQFFWNCKNCRQITK